MTTIRAILKITLFQFFIRCWYGRLDDLDVCRKSVDVVNS